MYIDLKPNFKLQNIIEYSVLDTTYFKITNYGEIVICNLIDDTSKSTLCLMFTCLKTFECIFNFKS